jgi:hypothetical protein
MTKTSSLAPSRNKAPASGDECLTYLIAGLVALTEQPQDYPYPTTLTRARGWLYLESLRHGPPAFQSHGAFLRQLQTPLRTWWPYPGLAGVDRRLDPEAVLLDEAFQLTPETTDLVEELDAEGYRWPATARELKQILDNRPIREVLRQTREAPERQSAYVALRRFLIEHPWLNAAEMAKFRDILHPFGQEPQAYYEPPGPSLEYERAYWACPCCGALLHWKDGRPRCTTSLCGRRKELVPEPGWRISGVEGTLNLTARRRIQLPGRPEIDLAKALQALPDVAVDLWPEADRYDLRVRVADRTWDLDVKDYERPATLKRHLVARERGESAEPRFYYVIPDYRMTLAPDYLSRLRKLAHRRDLRLASEVVEEVREAATGQGRGKHVRHTA